MLVPWGLNLGLGQSLSLRYREKLQDLRSRLCVCGFHSDVGQKLLDFHRFSVFVFIFYSSCKARSSTSRPRWAELEVWEATNSISRVEGKFAAINKWMCSCFPSIKCVLFDVYGTVISSALTPEGLFFWLAEPSGWDRTCLGCHFSLLPQTFSTSSSEFSCYRTLFWASMWLYIHWCTSIWGLCRAEKGHSFQTNVRAINLFLILP